MENIVIVVLGPTASGKSDISIEIAKKYNGEIVSADSMQIYKNMPIGTAQPTAIEQETIKHHMISVINPTQNYSVGQFQHDARKCIEDIHSRAKTAILCGGTGLYIDSVIYNMDMSNTNVDTKLRDELWQMHKKHGEESVYNILKDLDANTAKNIHINNTKRVIRAIEVIKSTGDGINKYNNSNMKKFHYPNTFLFGLRHDRKYLYDRINLRVDLMIDNGLIQEVRDLIKNGCTSDNTALKALGYKELLPYINNEESLDKCIDLIKQKTRNFAKRQISWFKRYDNIIWLDISKTDTKKQIVAKMFTYMVNNVFHK